MGMSEQSTEEMKQRIEALERSGKALQRTVEELQEREYRYRSLVEGIPVGLYRTDPSGRVIEANTALVEMLGFPDRAALLRMNSARFFVRPEDQEAQRRILERDGVLRGFEAELRRPDGTTLWVRDSARVVRRPGGGHYFQGSLEDIGKIREAERALRKSRNDLRGILDATLETIVLIDRAGTVVAANQTVCDRMGATMEALIGRRIYDFFPPGVAANRRRQWERVFDTGRPVFFEDQRAGRTFEQSAYPVFDDESRVEHVAVFARDITERKNAEEALRESEAKYRQIIQHAPAGIYEMDLQRLRFLSVNDVMCSYMGYSEEEFLALDPFDLLFEESRPALQNVLTEVLAGNPDPGPVEYRIRGKSGREFWVLVNSTFYFEEGVPKRATAVVHDITERKRTEKERARLEAQLRQAQKMEAIGTLAGGIAHDFNNILSAIVGYTEMAEVDLPEGSVSKRNLRRVLDASNRAKDLVNRILAFSRQTEHEAKPMRVDLVVKEVLKMLRSSLPTSIELGSSIAPDLPATIGDPTQVYQVLMNLCTNAAQAIEDEHGTIEVTVDEVQIDHDHTAGIGDLPPGPYVRLHIADTGAGMSAEVQERIFNPYFTTKEAGKGTGLGLAVVYGIVQECGGGIVVDSEPGQGTTFTVYFPATDQEESLPLETERDLLPLGQERILFVDDERPITELVKQYLDRLGYVVTTRQSSPEALELFRGDPRAFDLVVTDMTMPAMTGDELAEELLAIRPDLPIILCTGYSHRISEAKAREIGIRAFLMKPLTQQELARTVRRILDHV